MVLYTLFEHASGYAILKVIAQEEIGALLPVVQEAVMELDRFGKVMKLVSFWPFKTAANALENLNCITEGVVHEDLKNFLESNIPVGKKREKVTLGVSDPKLGAAIYESVRILCESGALILEALRGVRLHFHKLIPGLTAKNASKAQLGLGHSYSRAKVKFNVNKADNMIIQTIALVDQLDKDINTFVMRLREWYSYHFPELARIVHDNLMYSKVAKYIGSRKDLTEDRHAGLQELLLDDAKVKAVCDACRTSMGMDISPVDLINISSFAERVISLVEYRKGLMEYLVSKMHAVAPNLTAVIGEVVSARLIAHAGSLTNLAKYPASTVQILGAEKALFRAMKTRTNTPKYGLIFHSSFIGKAGVGNKGRIARFLANKCSIASRIDCFSDTTSDIIGKKLCGQIEERLKFYESGDLPKKNIDVMKEALNELANHERELAESTLKKKKKKKSKSQGASENAVDPVDVSDVPAVKRKHSAGVEDEDAAMVIEPSTKSKKSKVLEHPGSAAATISTPDTGDANGATKSKKKIKVINVQS